MKGYDKMKGYDYYIMYKVEQKDIDDNKLVWEYSFKKKKVKGYPIRLKNQPPNIHLFRHKSEGGSHIISEVSTGLRVSQARTLKAAKEMAEERMELTKVGVELYQENMFGDIINFEEVGRKIAQEIKKK